jgi:Fe-S cluster assembly scaffold protein SufB
MRTNRGIPHDLEREGKRLKKWQSAFWRNGDVMVQVWKDRRVVQMISMIHEATIVNTRQNERSLMLLYSTINS